MTLRLRPTPEHLKSLGDILPPATLRRLQISAVNDSSKYGETQLNKLIRDTLTLGRAFVDKAISRKTHRDDDRVFGKTITISRQAVSAKEYRPKATKQGVTVKFLKGGKRELFRKAFIAKKIGGHVFRRLGKKRLPLNEFKGPTAIGAVLRRDEDVRVIGINTSNRTSTRLESKVDYELQKLANKK